MDMVKRKWVSGRSAYIATYEDGSQVLFSYSTPIIHKCPNGSVAIATDYYEYSMTTRKHLGKLISGGISFIREKLNTGEYYKTTANTINAVLRTGRVYEAV